MHNANGSLLSLQDASRWLTQDQLIRWDKAVVAALKKPVTIRDPNGKRMLPKPKVIQGLRGYRGSKDFTYADALEYLAQGGEDSLIVCQMLTDWSPSAAAAPWASPWPSSASGSTT